MICNEVLKREGKRYPRTCAVHGLGPCHQEESDPRDSEGMDWVKRYAEAPGQVDRQWIVNEILQHDDGDENAVHRVLAAAARLLESE